MKVKCKKNIALAIGYGIVLLTSAQIDSSAITNSATAASSIESNSINWLLVVIAAIMLIPIYITGKTWVLTLKSSLKKSTLNGVIFILFLIFSNQLKAEVNTDYSNYISTTAVTWVLVCLIVFEALIIFIFSWQTNKVLINDEKTEIAVSGKPIVKKESKLLKFWHKINSFQSQEIEHTLDTGHNYDGIRELNNITPPWFTAAFFISIVFACVYLWRYHVSNSAPLQLAEFASEMEQAEKAKNAFLAKQVNLVDENNIAVKPEMIENGFKIFTQKCVACHGEKGQSSAGGAGPNLSDEFAIHGAGIKDIFKSIKYGWTEKGMKSWKEDLTPKQIGEVANYIYSIFGKNLPGGKEPQGDKIDKNINLSDSSVNKK